MSEMQRLEQLLAQQIKTIQKLTDKEKGKLEAVAKADLKLLARLQQETESLSATLQEKDKQIKDLAASVNLSSVSSQTMARINKLQNLLRAKVQAADDANQQNQQVLEELMEEMQKQLGRIRQGRKALKGYQKGMGLGGKKEAKILSDEI